MTEDCPVEKTTFSSHRDAEKNENKKMEKCDRECIDGVFHNATSVGTGSTVKCRLPIRGTPACRIEKFRKIANNK